MRIGLLFGERGEFEDQKSFARRAADAVSGKSFLRGGPRLIGQAGYARHFIDDQLLEPLFLASRPFFAQFDDVRLKNQ